MSDPFDPDPGERSGRVGQCYEPRPFGGGGTRHTRGTTSSRGGAPLPEYGACGMDSRAFYESTLAEMGVVESFPALYGHLAQRSRLADGMGYDRFCALRGDPGAVQQIVDGVVSGFRDEARTLAVQYLRGEVAAGAVLAPVEALGAATAFGELIQSAAERGLWERADLDGQLWRRQRYYWLLLAGTAMQMSGNREMTPAARQALQGLVEQTQRYERWIARHWHEYQELLGCERIAGGWPQHNGLPADLIHAAP